MHNNGYIDRDRSTRKEYYTVVEAAVLWARSDGAKNASDPRINYYTQLILASLTRGDLSAVKTNHASVSTAEDKPPSPSSTIAFTDLKKWMAEHVPEAKPAFLFNHKP